MTSRPLYEIVDALKAVEDLLHESGGEVTPELEAALGAVNLAFEAKIEGCVQILRNLEALGNANREEEKRQAARKIARWNRAEWLKDYLVRELLRADRKKVETPLFSVRVQASGRPVIRWTDPELPPPQGFRRMIPARRGAGRGCGAGGVEGPDAARGVYG
jgi:hypothetical protein